MHELDYLFNILCVYAYYCTVYIVVRGNDMYITLIVVFLVAKSKFLPENMLFLSLQINILHLVFALSVPIFVVVLAIACE